MKLTYFVKLYSLLPLVQKKCSICYSLSSLFLVLDKILTVNVHIYFGEMIYEIMSDFFIYLFIFLFIFFFFSTVA